MTQAVHASPHFADADAREALARRVAGARRTAAGFLLALLFLLSLLAGMRPRHFTLNGKTEFLRSAGTAADCARLLQIPTAPGDLRDASGAVLVKAGGDPPYYLRNGQPVGPEDLVRGGDYLVVCPPRDRREPLETRVERLAPSARLANGTPTALPAAAADYGGLRRVEYGRHTGKPGRVETMRAWPIVSATAQPKLLALTFDDGPNPYATPELLTLLAQYKAKATFFVLGEVAQAYPKLLQREVAGGHEIAVHSWRHDYLTRLSRAAVTADAERSLALIRSLTDPALPVAWERPPYGATNASVKAGIEAAGLRQILWSVDPQDWRKPGASVIASRVLARAHPGAVILCHDGGGDRRQTLAAVRVFLPALQAKGYRFVTLSELKQRHTLFTGEVNYTLGTQTYHVRNPQPALGVSLDGGHLDVTAPVLTCDGEIMLPAAPTLGRLGAPCVYDRENQVLRVTARTGEWVVRLDSRLVERNGREGITLLPALLHGGRAYLPLRTILDITGASAWRDEAHEGIHLFSPTVDPESPEGTNVAPWSPLPIAQAAQV